MKKLIKWIKLEWYDFMYTHLKENDIHYKSGNTCPTSGLYLQIKNENVIGYVNVDVTEQFPPAPKKGVTYWLYSAKR